LTLHEFFNHFFGLRKRGLIEHSRCTTIELTSEVARYSHFGMGGQEIYKSSSFPQAAMRAIGERIAIPSLRLTAGELQGGVCI
jgi:hypothetical protein